MLRVLAPMPEGPQITPFLEYQLERAWAFDAKRQARLARVKTEADLLVLQDELRAKAMRIMGGLPSEKTPLNARVAGSVPMDGYRIDKLVFESLPGIHVTALVYVPDAPTGRKPAVLLACGHSELGKAYARYQEIAARLARRGYVVLCWDPVGQGERSQFWDRARGRSRYNLVCGEHAVLGNLATLAGTSLVRYMVWDGMRAVDYLLGATTSTPSASPSLARAGEASSPSGGRARSPHPRRAAVLLPDGAADAHGEPHVRGPRQRPRAGPCRPRVRGRRSPGAAAARLPPRAPRLGGGAGLLPDRGHAQVDARGGRPLPPFRTRGRRLAHRGLPQAPVLGREPGARVRLPRPRVRGGRPAKGSRP
jgi:hypothetical protein